MKERNFKTKAFGIQYYYSKPKTTNGRSESSSLKVPPEKVVHTLEEVLCIL
jgi:hypothetical protein